MTKSESKFRERAKMMFGPNDYIKKMPDYKQVGFAGAKGLPDYLVIWTTPFGESKTCWVEVKVSKTKKIKLTPNDFTPQQKIEFPKMLKAGAVIMAYVFSKDLKSADIHYLRSDFISETWESSLP